MTDRNTLNGVGTNPTTRNQMVLLRVSAQERATLEAAAAATGTTLSAYTRTAALKSARRAVKVAA